jgi:hypothetical protein
MTGHSKDVPYNCVIVHRGQHIPVNGLDWLLERAKLVESMVVKANPGRGGFILTANLKDGDYFITTFTDKARLHAWLHRDIWNGVQVGWFSYTKIIPFDLIPKRGKHGRKDSSNPA